MKLLTRNDWWDDSKSRQEFSEILKLPAMEKALAVLRDTQIAKSALVVVQSTHPEFESSRQQAHNAGYVQCLMDLLRLDGPSPAKREPHEEPEPWAHVKQKVLTPIPQSQPK